MSRSATITDRLPPIHPGEILGAEFLEPLEMSARALARRIGVPPNRITAILAGRRGITGDTALRLARAFGTTPEFWLNLQMRHELESAQDALAGGTLEAIEPASAA